MVANTSSLILNPFSKVLLNFPFNPGIQLTIMIVLISSLCTFWGLQCLDSLDQALTWYFTFAYVKGFPLWSIDNYIHVYLSELRLLLH